MELPCDYLQLQVLILNAVFKVLPIWLSSALLLPLIYIVGTIAMIFTDLLNSRYLEETSMSEGTNVSWIDSFFVRFKHLSFLDQCGWEEMYDSNKK